MEGLSKQSGVVAFIFGFVSVTVTVVVFLFSNFSPVKVIDGLEGRTQAQFSEVKQEQDQMRSEMRDLRMDMNRGFDMARGEVEKVRDITTEILRRTPKMTDQASR